MQIITTYKNIIEALFDFHNKTQELDDSFFIPTIKHVINSVSRQSSHQNFREELTAFAMQEHVENFLNRVRESEPNCKKTQEIADVREVFVGYYNSHNSIVNVRVGRVVVATSLFCRCVGRT